MTAVAKAMPVTLLVTRHIAPEHDADFIAWIRRGILLAAGFPGFLGAGALSPTPGGDTYQVVLRFADSASLTRWEDSLARRMWLERGAALIKDSEVRRVDGLEAVFGLHDRQPPRWKRAISVWLMLFPVSLLVNTLLADWVAGYPIALRVLCTTLIQVPLMVYLGSPLINRVLKRWLLGPDPVVAVKG